MKKKKIRQRNLGELMSGILPSPTASTPTPAPTVEVKVTTAPSVTTSSPGTPEKKQQKAVLPSLKRTPSFSVKDAIAGKAQPNPVTSSAANSEIQGSSLTSISDISDDDDDIMDVSVDDVELTQKNLEIAWGKFADYIKPSRPRIFHTLQSTKPTLLEDNLITYDVMNISQKEDLQNTYNELINFLRRSLGAPNLEIDFTVAETESQSSRPYTVEEKFKHMIIKNPALLSLKQSLGLDFD